MSEEVSPLCSSLNSESLCTRLNDQILAVEVLVDVDPGQCIGGQLPLGELKAMLWTELRTVIRFAS